MDKTVKVQALVVFNDLVENTKREKGDAFYCTPKRANFLATFVRYGKTFPLVEILKTDTPLSELTYKELQAMAKEKGIKSVGIKKEELVKLLS